MTYAEWKEKFVDGVDFSGERGIIKLKEYVGKTIEKTDNQSVREWYVANVRDIPNQIDKDAPLEEQAKQAFLLRNKYKREARSAMSDKETVNILEQTRAVPEFEELMKDKMKRKGMTRDEAIADILKTSSKTNVDVDKDFGLRGD